MNRQTFEHLVAETLNNLPEAFQEKLENIEVVVQDWPDQETMRLAKMRSPTQLLGFYHGVPQTRRTHLYMLVLPDKISIFQRLIEMRAGQMKTYAELASVSSGRKSLTLLASTTNACGKSGPTE